MEQEKREKIPKEIEEDKQKTDEEENKGLCQLLGHEVLKYWAFIFLICLQFKEEKPENHPEGSWQEDSETERVYIQEFSFENNTYRVGDFVYVEPSEPNLKPHIVCIERLWEDKAGNTL